MKFEVRVNGKMICRAGVSDSYPYLCAEIARSVKRTRQGRLESNCKFGVAGSTNADFLHDQRSMWLLEDVTVGDEISIRLVEHGEIFEPVVAEVAPECHASRIVAFPTNKGQ